MKKVRIGDFLHRVKETIIIQDTEEYKRVTIKSKNQGIYLRNSALGKDIGTKKQFIISKGQFLLSKIDARFGAFGIVPENLDKAIITGNFWAYEVDKNVIDIELFNIFVSSKNFIEICSQASSGTTHRKYLDEKKFLNFEIDFPPLEEQKTIIKSYKKKNDCNILIQSEIQTQQELLKKLRQSILQEAIEGKLTKEWREKNPDVEQASVLLEKIKQEKEQLIKEKKIKKQKPLPPISEDEVPFEIPDSWVWCRLGDVITNIKGGGTPSKHNPAYWNGNIPWASVKDLKGNELFKTKDYITENGLNNSSSNLIEKDNLIISTRMGLGKILFNKINIAINQDLKALFIDFINKKHFFYTYKTYSILGRGTTVDGIRQEVLLGYLYPLPPLQEQKEIVKKIENLFAICDKLEIEIQSSKKSSEQLIQAVLKEAFEK